MKLFAHPGASSLSVHTLLREIGVPFELGVVNVTKKLRADGGDFREISQRGMVPVLEMNDGSILTENLVIAQFLCDRANRTDLMPAYGTIERYRVTEWQSFIAAELHKDSSPLFWPVGDETHALVRGRLLQKYQYVSERLGDQQFLTGDTFTAADAYLFPILSWTLFFKIDITPFPNLLEFLRRVGARASVQEALAAEGPGLVTRID